MGSSPLRIRQRVSDKGRTRCLSPLSGSRHPISCRLAQDRCTLSTPAYSATNLFFPSTHRSRRRSALFLVFSVCIERTELGMAPRCGALFPVNGTAVLDGITFRPFSTNFDGYSFGGAGGWALQRAVTKLKVHWSMLRPPVQPEDSHAAPAVARSPVWTILLEPNRFLSSPTEMAW